MNRKDSPAARKLRVLFVCFGNSCRSPMAESIARRDAADLVEASSAGLVPLGVVQKLTLRTLEANGYPSEDLQSKAILEADWVAADVVINMSGYAREKAFGRSDVQKVEDWDVQDPFGANREVYQRIFEDIRTRIVVLAARLRARKSS